MGLLYPAHYFPLVWSTRKANAIAGICFHRVIINVVEILRSGFGCLASNLRIPRIAVDDAVIVIFFSGFLKSEKWGFVGLSFSVAEDRSRVLHSEDVQR